MAVRFGRLKNIGQDIKAVSEPKHNFSPHPSSVNEGPTRHLPQPGANPVALLTDVRELILSARQAVARGVNTALVVLYWQVGNRIRREVLREKRAEYGEEIVATLSQQLTAEFGGGFSRFNLARMVQFAEVFPEERIVATLSRQLGWSHFVELLPLRKHLQRDFYAEMCRVEQKLHDAVRLAQARLAQRPTGSK
jgi:hypothetical protein